MKLNLPLVAVATVLATSALSISPAQAQGFYRSNSTGAVGGGSTQGSNGGSAGCVGGVRYGQSGAKACGVQGENGSAYKSTGSKSGTGSYRVEKGTYTNPTTGNTVSNSSKNVYNAQTDTGNRSVSKGATVNGTSYGYDTNNTYNYTKGSGVNGSTTVQTKNNGAYNCTYATGSAKTCVQP